MAAHGALHSGAKAGPVGPREGMGRGRERVRLAKVRHAHSPRGGPQQLGAAQSHSGPVTGSNDTLLVMTYPEMAQMK